MLNWLYCTGRGGIGGGGEGGEEEEERRRKNKESSGRRKESDIPSSHLNTILTACRDDPLAMNSNGRDS